jgi:gliding motility-associated-like protein
MHLHQHPALRQLLLAVLILCARSAHAVLDPPDLRCASVLPSGDVQISWVAPADPDNLFQEYQVYQSNFAGGPYTQVGSIPVYGLSSWTHVGAGADTGQRFYYMVTVTVEPPPNASLPSDTLASMFLDVGQSSPLGSATLDWTLLHQPPLPTSAAEVQVQMEHPIGTWTTIASLPNTEDDLDHLIDICDDSLTFRIRLQDQLGCISFSNLDGDQFEDVTAPTPPLMVNLSVDTATGQTVLDWDPSPEGDTQGYIIVLVANGGNVIVDTIYGQATTTYVWAGSDAWAGPESYTVAAFDTCYSGNPPAPNTSATRPAHTTVFASTTYDKCAAAIEVSWTPYGGWTVANYELYCRIDNGPPFLLATLGPGASAFLHEAVAPFRTYCYVVKAVGGTPGQASLSNKACRTTSYPPVPQSVYVSNVTVDAPDVVQVTATADAATSAGAYHIERSNNGEPWVEVALLPGTTPLPITYVDTDVQTAERSYMYRVLVDDSCGAPGPVSNIGTSILLVAEASLDGVNRLRWNGYAQWAGSSAGFNIYRSIADGPFVLIASNPAGLWEYADNVNPYIASNGRFCYFVEEMEAGNPSGANAISVSNVACAVQPEAVWVPNAFIAGGVNDRFQPVVAFVDVKGYQLTIYNRWGQEIWSTDDRNEGWKGMVNGVYVPQGVYAYYCGFFNGAGQKFEERGTVTFLCCPD